MRHGRLPPALLICVSLGVVLTSLPALAHADEAPALSREQMAEFLMTAKVIGSRGTSSGVTRPRRLTLTDGTITQDALFQSVDESKSIQRFDGGRVEMNFRDSWVYNVAAFRVAELVGLGDMVPVTVERVHDGQRGSLAWWLTVKWDERARRKAGAVPPDRMEWSRQVQTMRVFTELVQDTDRNLTNMLITEDWRLWMVDFSRAFRRHTFLRQPTTLLQCSRALRDRLATLTREEVAAAAGPYLTPGEIDALLRRRDLILERLDKLAAERGEDHVYF